MKWALQGGPYPYQIGSPAKARTNNMKPGQSECLLEAESGPLVASADLRPFKAKSWRTALGTYETA